MIQSTSTNDPFRRIDAVSNAAPKPARVQSAVGHDRLSAEQAQSLKDSLALSPEIRPEVVARGMQLARDPNYPPREIIEQVSALIVNSQDPSEIA